MLRIFLTHCQAANVAVVFGGGWGLDSNGGKPDQLPLTNSGMLLDFALHLLYSYTSFIVWLCPERKRALCFCSK